MWSSIGGDSTCLDTCGEYVPQDGTGCPPHQ